MLQARGLTPNDCPEEWNVSHAEDVQAVAKAYADAGSDLILTNTFGGSPCKLKKMGFGDQVATFNAAGAKNSLAVAGDALVAGSVGPTGEFIEPLGDMTGEQMQQAFGEQMTPMIEAGLGILCIETMSAVEEVACAARAARSLRADIELIGTFTFDKTPNGYRTMMGVDPKRVVDELGDLLDVVGSNCGNGIEGMIEIAAEFRKHTDKPILIHANAGVPQLVEGKTVFRETPEQMAGRIAELIQAGATIVGGCCGTTPEHISAIKAEVDKLR
jgi:5-methyltetrahydrofolate--homocysteine methyltransferase